MIESKEKTSPTWEDDYEKREFKHPLENPNVVSPKKISVSYNKA